ncbi:hypothetical protein LOTGIDRAFT_154494 [Lottia gigantea]|uniref:GAIN-B domain-containing protein n=1 Tax=Lottia gigantea TaxID=225164 RepID=V4BLA4_LOTGI|nr:hypothetical protein LOTGIDRAFT_154494 [Lottia gigantea]ESO89384.1 hypothetical protein LOTGIDRAFT_154494 [Lottia gigantea]
MNHLQISVLLVVATLTPSEGFKFGFNNSYTCHCKNDEKCDIVTGRCDNGCLKGWGGPSCQQVIEIGRSSSLTDIEFPKPAASTYPEWLKSSSNKALVKKDTLMNYYKDNKDIGYNAVFYNDISKIVEGKILYPGETMDSQNNITVDINSKILALSINPPPTGKLDPPIELSFQHLSDNYSSPTCVFLDLKAPYDKRGRWSTEGCKTESTSNPNVTICKCDHLTNFAILMSPGKTVKEALEIKKKRYRAKSIDTGAGTKSDTQSNQTRSTCDNDKVTSFIDEKSKYES